MNIFPLSLSVVSVSQCYYLPAHCINLWAELIKDWSILPVVINIYWQFILCGALNSARLFFLFALSESSLPPFKSYCLPIITAVLVCFLSFGPLPGPLPINRSRQWNSYPGVEMFIWIWSLMFTHHFPVGSDSLRLSSATSSSLLADTSRLTYPQEADVFSCQSLSILTTWQCSIVRLIYLFIFKCYLLGYLHEIHVSFLWGTPGRHQLWASQVAWSCQDLPSAISWWPFSLFRLQVQTQVTL